MAGTNKTRAAVLGGPSVILVHPQLGENIGKAARAMLNFGLTDLRLVAPRDGWPNEKAVAAASGAAEVLDAARVYPDLASATEDLHFLYATTARDRAMAKEVLTAREAAARLRGDLAQGHKSGLMFGAERTGLTNDEIAQADMVLTIPVNPAFGSLNLAQAVVVAGYEWFMAADATPAARLDYGKSVPATRKELNGLFDHLENELDISGFLYPPDKRPSMVRNLRAIFERAALSDQEVRTLRGAIKAIAKGRPRGGGA